MHQTHANSTASRWLTGSWTRRWTQSSACRWQSCSAPSAPPQSTVVTVCDRQDRPLRGLEILETELDELVVGGAGSIPRHMADDLGDKGKLGYPIWEVEWSNDLVHLRGPSGTVHAKRVIFAISPADAGGIQFLSGLASGREQLHRGWSTALPSRWTSPTRPRSGAKLATEVH